jgi:hypothetical protein
MSTDDPSLSERVAILADECITLAAALHTVMSESEDPESVRTSIAALFSTPTGRSYYEMHPLRI